MSFELKNAVKEWKKVKPLLLTHTGVSAALRFLEAWDPSNKALTEELKKRQGK